MKIPAVVFCDPVAGQFSIAALSTLDRLLVAVHRAGCGPIFVVCPSGLPAVKRASALGISFEVVVRAPVISGPALLASDSLLLNSSDIKKLLATKGRLVSVEGLPLAGFVREFGGEGLNELENGGPVAANCDVVPVFDECTARAAERWLWTSLTSSSDGLVDKYFNRPVGRPLSKLLIYTSISPNQVSISATVIGVISAVCFALGSYFSALLGAILFQISAVVDCVDGDLARVLFKESRLGKWLDIIGDQLVHIAVFACLAVGLWRAGTVAPVFWLGMSAAIGAAVSFLVILRGMRLGETERPGMLQLMIDRTTNRDFSVLVLALAVVDQLEWFLWMAAIGSHVFWILALSLQPRRSKAAA